MRASRRTRYICLSPACRTGTTPSGCGVEDGRTAVFALLKDALLSVDIEKKEVVVSAKRFGEIAVYED